MRTLHHTDCGGELESDEAGWACGGCQEYPIPSTEIDPDDWTAYEAEHMEQVDAMMREERRWWPEEDR